VQRNNTENLKQIFPEKNCPATVPISTFMFFERFIYSQDRAATGKYVDRSWEYINVEIGTDAAQFPEKEYINGIFVQCISWINNRQRRPMLLDVVGLALPLPLLEIRKILRQIMVV
jgi:hypothetical protein